MQELVTSLTKLATTVMDNQTAFVNRFLPGYMTTPIKVIGYDHNQFGDLTMKVVGTVHPSKRWWFEDAEKGFNITASRVITWAENIELYSFVSGDISVK